MALMSTKKAENCTYLLHTYFARCMYLSKLKLITVYCVQISGVPFRISSLTLRLYNRRSLKYLHLHLVRLSKIKI